MEFFIRAFFLMLSLSPLKTAYIITRNTQLFINIDLSLFVIDILTQETSKVKLPHETVLLCEWGLLVFVFILTLKFILIKII